MRLTSFFVLAAIAIASAEGAALKRKCSSSTVAPTSTGPPPTSTPPSTSNVPTSTDPPPTSTPPSTSNVPTTTSSSSSPDPTGTGSSGPIDPSWLFPVAFKNGFTTATQAVPQDSDVTHIPLSDDALNLMHIESGVTHDIKPAPDGTLAYEADYPKGSWNPQGSPKGGFGFYVGDPTGFTFEDANELLFSYSVYFQSDFMFNKGGKLPGPYGGTSADEAFECSGGRQTGRNDCFDLRLMFRTNGMGEIYAYLPEVPQNDVLLNLPGSVKDDSYGFSIARGAFSFIPGQWNTVAQRVKLNDPGQNNGELELFVNGVSKISATQVVIREYANSTFRGAHFQTFFGGSTSDWGSPQDQSSWFTDISAALIA